MIASEYLHTLCRLTGKQKDPPKIVKISLSSGYILKMLNNYNLVGRSYLKITFLRPMLGFLPTAFGLQAPPTHSNLITRSKIPKIRNYLGKS